MTVRRPGRTRIAMLLAVLVLTGPYAAHATTGAGPQVQEQYRPPVDAPVTDPFRLPEHDWLPGNRGLEYGTQPGQFVRAVGSGIVTFAGQVGGQLHVTVQHPDGLRSSYSFVASIRARVGDRVRGGDLVAIAGPDFHLGIRRGDLYVDPASIFGQPVGGGTIRLVPVDGPATIAARRPGGSPRHQWADAASTELLHRGFEALRRHWGSRRPRG